MTDRSEQLSLPLVEGPAVAVVEPGESASSITRDELNALPIRSYQGPVVLVNNDEDTARAIVDVSKEKLLGFDTETKPVFHAGVSHPPALIQLAGAEQAWIFQLRNLKSLNELFAILSNPKITKAGVAIADDIKKLREVHEFRPANFVEVGDLARKLGYTQTGLRTLAGLALGFRVSKREQRSNWARAQLTPSQITYAATDAWVSRELYLALSQRVAERGAGERVAGSG